MSKTKLQTKAPDKTSSEPITQKQPSPAESNAGPSPAARTAAAALPPPNGKPSAARAAEVMRAPQTAGASSKARMMQGMQRSVGNARLSRMLGAPVQAKLTVGAPGDSYEQEADRVATQVVSLMASSTQAGMQRQSEDEKIDMSSINSFSGIQKKCAACEEDLVFQMKPAIQKSEQASNHASEDLAGKLASSSGSGHAIPEHVREDIGGKMGADFSDVRIHTNSSAIQMNEELGAHAFTHGTDIYFNQGKYDPHSSQGQQLLAHELTHVVQQTGKVQTFQPPDIQKFDAHEKIEEQLRLKNPEMITEAPIPGGETLGKGFTKQGYADLYKSTGSVIPGITSAKYRKEEDETTGKKTEKFAYKNLTDANSLKKAKGKFTRNPQLVKEPVSVIHENGNVKYFVKKDEVPASTRGTLITGAFPQDFFVGDIKKGDDSLILAGTQLTNYRKGLHEFSQFVNRDFGIAVTNEGKLYDDVKVPKGLDYSEFATQNATLGEGHLTEQAGKYLRRYWLYPYREKGLYLYIWLPHPWTGQVTKYQQAGKDVVDELDRVNKGLKVTQKKPGKSLDTKRKKGATNNRPAASTVRRRIRRKTIQRDTDWAGLRTAYMAAREAWKDKYATKYLKKEEIDDIVEEKVEFDKKVGIPASAHGDFAKVARQFKQIEFWSGPKGRAVGELRFLLGDKFDKVAGKFEDIKKRTKKTRAKADTLSGSKISAGWKKKVIRLLMEGFKMGFKVFIAETYSIFAGCIGGMIQKFEESFTSMEEIETLAAQLEGLKTQVESLLNEITTQYEAQMKLFEDILDQMEDIKFYAEILSTAETLIRVGVQVVSCFSPPALGCLWGLVAQIGIEVGLDLVVGTEWFENEFMRPLVKDLIDKFLKDDILSFMNKLFTAVGLGDYMKDVDTCKVRVGASVGAGRGWYSGKPQIPAAQYRKHAAEWEAKYKDQLLDDIVAAFDGGASGKTVTKADIEKLMKEVQDKNMSPKDFKGAVQTAKKGEHKYDFSAVQGAVQAAGAGGGQDEAAGGSRIPVIDASKQATEDEDQGTQSKSARIQVDAKSIHTKGSSPDLTIWLFENGEHIATAVNVPSTVTKRKWWPSESEKKKLEVYYLIPKKIPFVKGYFLAKGRTIVGYSEP
jgi:hypothetical protein